MTIADENTHLINEFLGDWKIRKEVNKLGACGACILIILVAFSIYLIVRWEKNLSNPPEKDYGDCLGYLCSTGSLDINECLVSGVSKLCLDNKGVLILTFNHSTIWKSNTNNSLPGANKYSCKIDQEGLFRIYRENIPLIVVWTASYPTPPSGSWTTMRAILIEKRVVVQNFDALTSQWVDWWSTSM